MPTPVAIPVVQTSRTGVQAGTATVGDVTNGHVVANDGHVILLIVNADTNPHNLTVAPASATGPDGLSVGSKTVPVAASKTVLTSRWPVGIYGSSLGVTVDSAQLSITAYQV